MSEIPDDIMKVAQDVYKDLLTTCERWNDDDAAEDIPAIARAILAECQRCAKMAERIHLQDEIDNGAAATGAAHAVATAIRGGSHE